jgi:flotillin
MGPGVIILIIVAVILFFTTFITVLARYKKCPSDRILVIFGKVGRGSDGGTRSAKCIHGGAAFIWPLFQDYAFLSLTPMSITVDLTSALSKQNIRIDVPSRFTVGISTENGIMQNAAERLLGLGLKEIEELAKDIIFGQLRLVVATMDIEEINTDRDLFLEAVSSNVESELKKIGLRLINVNVTDINDESGYIEALGKEAAAKAINDAKKSVAEKDRDGAIGQALAQKDERINVAEANSQAIEGENTAKITIANSDALRREREAEALRRATASEKVQTAKALQEAYAAEEAAELQRASREKASREADIIIKAEIEKRKMEIDAEAEAERYRRMAKGEADAIFAKMEAQARGINEILVKQALGFKQIIGAANGDSDAAVRMMIADKMEDIVKVQVEAIKNLKIDKVTVWDSGNGKGESSTANFLSGLMKSIPPMNELFNMAGMQLPEYLGKEKDAAKTEEAPAEPEKE